MMKLTKLLLPISTMALLLLASALGMSPVTAQSGQEVNPDSSDSTLLISQEGEEDPEDLFDGDDSDNYSDGEEDQGSDREED